MKCNILNCGKIEGGFEDGICLPCYAFITTGERAWVGLTEEAKTELLTALRKIKTKLEERMTEEEIDALEALTQPEQEPVAFLCHGNLFMWPSEDDYCGNPEDHIPLYTTPPKRTWVGLTDEEIKAFDTWHDNREEEVGWCNPSEIVAYIEAKLKEKNT